WEQTNPRRTRARRGDRCLSLPPSDENSGTRCRSTVVPVARRLPDEQGGVVARRRPRQAERIVTRRLQGRGGGGGGGRGGSGGGGAAGGGVVAGGTADPGAGVGEGGA